MSTFAREMTTRRSSVQDEIDEIQWYHDFDFPGGLRARTETPDKEFHRRLWAFIQRNLDQIELRDKSVLDIGCWDGYWSFYAERRGARAVLATDDVSQNWASGTGLSLAKRLYSSQIGVNQQLSVYDVASLDRKFDVIFCLGVYYHLYDPYYAFAQVRHCCHQDTIVVFEGDVDMAPRKDTAVYRFDSPAQSAFVPSRSFLHTALQAAYFDIVATDYLWRPDSLPLYRRAQHYVRNVLRSFVGRDSARLLNRALVVCKPFVGESPQHHYTPPFGLRAYDPRFNAARS